MANILWLANGISSIAYYLLLTLLILIGPVYPLFIQYLVYPADPGSVRPIGPLAQLAMPISGSSASPDVNRPIGQSSGWESLSPIPWGSISPKPISPIVSYCNIDPLIPAALLPFIANSLS